MANARRESDHDVAIATICHLGASFAGKLRPYSANPYRNANHPKTEEQRREESKEGFAVIGAALRQIAVQKGQVAGAAVEVTEKRLPDGGRLVTTRFPDGTVRVETHGPDAAT
jgi:hypothetical protein